MNRLLPRLAWILAVCGLSAAALAAPQSDRRDLPPVEIVRDVVYATAPDADGAEMNLFMDVAFPRRAGADPLPVVIYIHGGAWSGGSRREGMPMVNALARGGYLAATIDYRLSGDAPYPAAVHDCKAAVRFMRRHADDLGIDPDRIGAFGHSAGGHLAALLGTSAGAAPLEGGDTGPDVATQVQCVVAISAPADLVRAGPRGREAVNVWLQAAGDGAYEHLAAEASPVTYIDQSDPPFLLVHGLRDRLVPPDQAERFRDALLEAGVPVEFLPVPEAGHSIREPAAYVRVAEFFDEHLGGRAGSMLRAAMEGRDDRRPSDRRPTDRRPDRRPAEAPPPRSPAG